MLKGRGRDPRLMPGASPHHFSVSRAPLAKPEPDYEVVDFPSEQYVNAKLEPPPPPPPRPPTGHPLDAGASCGLCGGLGARVRCTECGRRALCASCDDMYHRHPKRRHHQRQALSQTQLRDERPPLPPKGTPPVPPPRRHKMSGDRSNPSPVPSTTDLRRATMTTINPPITGHIQKAPITNANHFTNQRPQMSQLPPNAPKMSAHMGSMPYLPGATNQVNVQRNHDETNMRQFSTWGQQRGPLTGFNVPVNMLPPTPIDSWGLQDNAQSWGRPMRRGTSVMELSGNPVNCTGCGHCAPNAWRYDSCSNLDHPWTAAAPWGQSCCMPHNPRMHPHLHAHIPQTPQPYRRDSRAMSRAASRAGSRAASPALSVRSRASRRTKHRTPTPSLPSSDADSESEAESDDQNKNNIPNKVKYLSKDEDKDDSLGPAPSPPSSNWQCEHCTFVNEPGVRVCAVCCRTPIATPKVISADNVKNDMKELRIAENSDSNRRRHSSDKITARKDLNEVKSKSNTSMRTSKDHSNSPSKDKHSSFKPVHRLSTPTRTIIIKSENVEKVQYPIRQDIAVGPSPPKELDNSQLKLSNSQTKNILSSESSRSGNDKKPVTQKYSVSVGPSPPRENPPSTSPQNLSKKVSVGVSSQQIIEVRPSSRSSRTSVSNTGTSPPPQNISTQTYEMPNNWDITPSASRTRQRRRFRDEVQRERSHSRLSLSSDTRESDRSVQTSGSRWEWPRDSSPNGEWSENERKQTRLTRRASHLDVRRGRPSRRSSMFGSEAPSPEPLSHNRAISLEAIAGNGSKREIERGLELVQLMEEAEKMGFSAAEVHAALAQNPAAPLAWLKERWPSLCAGVRAAAARLAPGANISELEARASLAKHRGAMWPAVTECVERSRRKADMISFSEEGKMRGHVWGPPVGADDDSVPPLEHASRSRRPRAEDSSDEYAESINKLEDDDWMYLPLNLNIKSNYTQPKKATKSTLVDTSNDIAEKLKELLTEVGITSINEQSVLQNLLSSYADTNSRIQTKNIVISKQAQNTQNIVDLDQQENDFIDAYNDLARLGPTTNLDKNNNHSENHNIVTNSIILNKNQKSSKDSINIKRNYTNKETENNVINIKQISPMQTKLSNTLLSQDEKFSPSKSDFKNNSNEVSVVSPPLIGNLQNHQLSSADVKNEIASSSKLHKKEETQKPQTPVFKIKSIKESQSRIQEEKTNNLNEIFDNTQKLIQQMKNEINTDIISISDKVESHDEADNSSDDSLVLSEQESSYSNTPNESDNVTSDEKEITSSEEEFPEKWPKVEEQFPEKRLNIRQSENKTSSDDNEQFEEAMDHLDNQIDDMKKSNIEILDSIAQSLKEEHTLAVEVNDLYLKMSQNCTKDDMPTLNAKINIETNSKTIIHSINDNQISSKLTKTPSPLQDEDIDSQLGNISNLEKVSTSPVNIVNYYQPQITEITNNNLIDVHSQRKEEKPYLKKTVVSKNTFTMVNSFDEIYDQINSSESTTSQLNDAALPENVTKISDENNKSSLDNLYAKYEIVSVLFKPETPLSVYTHELKYPLLKATSENMTEITNDINITNTTLEHTKEVTHVNETNENDILNVTDDNSVNNSKIINTVEANTDVINITSEEFTKSDMKENDDSNNTMQLRVVQDESKSKNFTVNKSNIPKLVKSLQKSKQTAVQKIAKVITSKVPVRKTSIKLIAAPPPPKSHFRNINNGNVRQLQTRVFENKVSESTNEEVKPSTSASTTSKKKQAPSPPIQQKLQSTNEKISGKHEKKHFFRETCRTEDEWTESDSGNESQDIVRRPSDIEVTPQPYTPCQPVTLREISGQLIDLSKIRLLEGSPERQARMLLAEGAAENWEQAQLAVELILKGNNTPDALLAALECSDITSALVYLHQDCELCASKYPEHEMVSMFRCTHRCCRECARHYFTVQITERSIADCVCPYCKEPELENLPEDDWLDYFAHMDILLKSLLDVQLHELFQRKLRDRTLARDPNFRWCVECSSGFFVHPKQKKLRCPECKSISCAQCRKPWTANHNGLTCEQYAAWLEDNDPERSIAAVQQHLKENGLECPRCRFKYSLSRGGCMHFTCTQCKYEFCYGCGKPFMMGAQCGLSDYCAKLGLHSHHPRNCLFYLRDKEPRELQTLLQMNNVDYETKESEGSTGRCPIQLQRETPTGLIDTMCGSEVSPNQAGLCKMHYVEYLAGLARELDPIPIMEVSELVAELRRRALPLPERGPWDSDPIYAGMCAEIVREKIPLD